MKIAKNRAWPLSDRARYSPVYTNAQIPGLAVSRFRKLGWSMLYSIRAVDFFSKLLPQQILATNDSATVTITGKVVAAACYLLHAPAATAASHKECGAACLASGVPLVIAADDGTLYFPADGNQWLKTLLNARVCASGTVVEKHEPMELKMPVGDKNQIVVRVEGGYKLMTIQTLEKLPLTKRPPA